MYKFELGSFYAKNVNLKTKYLLVPNIKYKYNVDTYFINLSNFEEYFFIENH